MRRKMSTNITLFESVIKKQKAKSKKQKAKSKKQKAKSP